MKCAYDPDRDAIAKCSHCNKLLCDQCAIPEREDSFICSRCAALRAAQDVVQGIDQHREEKESRRQIREARKQRRPYLKRLILVSSILGIMVVGLNLHLRATLPKWEKSALPQHPLVIAIILDQAIRDYSEDHNGEVPHSLYELLDHYISSEEIEPGELDNFYYNRISPHSYELRPEKFNDKDVMKLILTEARVK
jgi:hypothetical protein